MSKYQSRDYLVEIDKLIKTGLLAQAQKAILKIQPSKLSRNHLVEFCSLARRCDKWELGLSTLKPYIYSKVKNRETASKTEKIEYALGLRRAGALVEAEKILEDPALGDEPKANLARAFVRMVQWDYANAILFLDKYLKFDLTEYDELVARVNRFACIQATGSSKFSAEMLEVEGHLKGRDFPLLWCNFQQVAAQGLIESGEYSEAEKRLDYASRMDGGPYVVLVHKWQKISAALRQNSADEMMNFRSEALKTRDWETLRCLDHYMTRLDPSCRWAERVYFGTPYPDFRAKLEKLRSFADESWISGLAAKQTEFDPWFPKSDEGEIPHRLLVYLMRDWYRPSSIGGIFEHLYQNEHFDSETSDDRVRQHIYRLRTWIQKNGFPLRLSLEDGQFGIRPLESSKIRVRKKTLGLDKMAFVFGRYENMKSESLSKSEWSDLLHISVRQGSYLIRQAVDSGWLAPEGMGRYTSYRLVGK